MGRDKKAEEREMERIPPCVTSQHGAVWYVTVCLGMHGHTSKLALSRLANTKLHLQGKQLVLFDGGLHFMTFKTLKALYTCQPLTCTAVIIGD